MDDLIDLFGAVAGRFQARLQQLPALETLGLASFPARVLALIGRYPGCSQQELAAWTGRDKAQVARAIKELEARAWINRAAHHSDWRAYSAHLTRDGHAAFALLEHERREAGTSLFASLSSTERDLLRHTLVKLQTRLSSTFEH